MRLFAIAGVVALGLAEPTLACSCLRTDTDRIRFDRASYVFSARITGARELRDSSNPRIESSFAVGEVIKGDPSRLARLWSYLPFGPESNSCAISFTVGQSYIFLVSEDGLVHYCSGSRRYNPALEAHLVSTLRDLAQKKAP